MRCAPRYALSLLALALALPLGSCSRNGGPSGPVHDPSEIPTRTVSGTVTLPDGAQIDLSTLEVVSFAGRSEVSSSGAFRVLVPDTDLPQAVVVTGEDGPACLLGFVEPGDVNDIVIDASTTALALVMLNPFTIMYSAEDRATVAQMVRDKDWWPELVAWASDVIAGSTTGSLDAEHEPGLMQLAGEIAIDVLTDFPAGQLPLGDPWLEDLPGDAVACANPDPVYYAAAFARVGGTDSLVVMVDSDRSRIDVAPGWPPILHVTGVTETSVVLDDGTFDVSFTRGDFRTFDPATPNGLAGTYNVGRGIVEVLALAAGVLPERDPRALDLESVGGSSGLGTNIGSGDTYGFIDDLLGFVADESDRVAAWYWEDENPDCDEYIRTMAPLLRGILFSTQVLAAGENRIPYFARLVTRDPQESQRITQLDGVMTIAGFHEPPDADFDVTPPFALPGQLITFDAGATTDADDALDALEVRWDWENDGVWDTTWSTQKVVLHSFVDARAHPVALQVRDPRQLNDSVVHSVNVGGSEESASHIVILRDEIPWAPDVPPILDQMLEVMEFTAGPGPNQYEVVGSNDLGTFPFTPGEDLVIVQGDQSQRFYDSYAANQVRLIQFVADGGTVLWEACDRGSHGGSIGDAGIVLPGAVVLEPRETWYNYVALPGAPIVEGLPSLLYGQFASHAGMDHLPDGATTYVTDDAGWPTLAEFSYGDGWVIMTTEPLEWNFYYNWTAGGVMPHVVSYVTGIPLIHDFGDIVKPDLRGRPRDSGGARGLTSGMH
jgi:hypothetical protein